MSIAEDVVNGLQCSNCGVCFEEESGFPVLCDDCFKEQCRIDLITSKSGYAPIPAIPKSEFKEM